MLYFLLDGYVEKILKNKKRKISDLSKKEIITNIVLPVLGAFICFLSLILKRDYVTYGALLVYFIAMGINLYFCNSQYRGNYSSYAEKYNKKLDAVKDLLKESVFNYYSKEKVEDLIEQYELMLSKEKESDQLINLISKFVKVLIWPILIGVISIIFSSLNEMDKMMISIGAIIILFCILALYVSLYPAINTIVNRRRYDMQSLVNDLKDLLRREFI